MFDGLKNVGGCDGGAMMFYSEEELGCEGGAEGRSDNALHRLYRTLPHPCCLLATTQQLLRAHKDVTLSDVNKDVVPHVDVQPAVSHVEAHSNQMDVSQAELGQLVQQSVPYQWEAKRSRSDSSDIHMPDGVQSGTTISQLCGKEACDNADVHQVEQIDVNQLDQQGNTPLSLLVLHINRGLRYHTPPVPQIQRLVDLAAPLDAIEQACIDTDAEYQNQVYASIQLLLSRGADPNFVPEKCPSIAHDLEWTKAYENKLLQQEGRWHLLDRGLKMDLTKFNFFDPVAVSKVQNTMNVSLLHLAAWRGSARCLRLLVDAGADVNCRASDGRGALHFLYQYCNKPGDLVPATQLLIDAGISVCVTDSFGQAPFQSLLKHTLISRSYVKYLANSYTPEYLISDPSLDHYQDEVRQCIELLLGAGQDVQHVNKWRDGALHILLYHFSSSIEDAEHEFQVRRHYLVPYQFRLKPVTNMMQFLLDKGCQANARDGCGRSALHSIVVMLQNLAFHEQLNSVQDVTHCLSVLFTHGADPNIELNYGQTAAHMLAQVIKSCRSQTPQYTQILELLIDRGLCLNARDKFGKAFLHYVLQTKEKIMFENKDLEKLVVLALRSGADPDGDAEPGPPANYLFYEHERKYPLTLLLRAHIYHHHPEQGSCKKLEGYLSVIHILSQCMGRPHLQRAFYQYCDHGVCGVFCQQQCPVFELLFRATTQPRSLAHTCRLTIWRAAGARLNKRVEELPLPRDIKNYVMWTS